MGKRRRKLQLLRDADPNVNPLSSTESSDSDSDSDSPSMITDSQPAPASTSAPPSTLPPSTASPPPSAIPPPSDGLPGTDPRTCPDLARSYDHRPSNDLARNSDPRSSSGPAPRPDPRSNLANAPVHSANDHRSSDGPYLSPLGSFLVVQPVDDSVSFRKLNVFWPQKQVSAICGPNNTVEIEAPANGTLVLKTTSRKDTKALLRTTIFCEKQVKVSLHHSRNSCKGTIYAPELRHMSEEEILADLRGDGVTHIRRLTTFRDGQRRDTPLLVLTFDSTSLPEKLVIGWLRKDVRVFVPNPLRCYKCQRFGHGSSTCRQTARCAKCGDAPHEGTDCTTAMSCLSCGSSDHSVSSNQCPTWKTEKRICELKATSGITYPEARRKVNAENSTPTPGTSYAKAARPTTVSSSTQTEPLAVLPPLSLLTPLKPTTVATTSTVTTATTSTQESMMVHDEAPTTQPSPAAVQPSPAAVQPSPAHRSAPTAGSSAGWQIVSRGRPNRRDRSDGKPVPSQAPYPSPFPRPTPSRPAVRVAGGRSRSQSLGRALIQYEESIWGPPDRAGPSKSS